MLPPPTIFPLAEAAAAHARLESGDNIGKIILTGLIAAVATVTTRRRSRPHSSSRRSEATPEPAAYSPSAATSSW